MKKTLTALFTLLTTMNPTVTALGSAAVAAGAAFAWVNEKWALLIARIDAMAVAAGGGSLNIQPLGFVNTFIPLQEACTYFTAWVALLLVCATIRIIKSFVPTVAS